MIHDSFIIWVQIATAAIQSVTFVAIFVYTLETSKLRRQGERQLNLLREQVRLGVLPAVMFGVRSWSREASLAVLRQSRDFETDEMQARARRIEQRDRNFVCSVAVQGDRIAHGIQGILYDASRREYLLSDQGADILPDDRGLTQTFTGEVMDYESVVRNHRRVYGDAGEFMARHLMPREESFIAVIFADASDRLYLRIREFVATEAGSIGMRRAALHYALDDK